MKVLLRDDVAGVGKRGDIVKVAGGFRPQPPAAGGQGHRGLRRGRGPGRGHARSRGTCARPRTGSPPRRRPAPWPACRSPCRPGPGGGRLFGSVSAADIVDAVEAAEGAVVDRKDLVLDEPIKTVGDHNVRVELFGGVVFELTVEVVGRRLTGFGRSGSGLRPGVRSFRAGPRRCRTASTRSVTPAGDDGARCIGMSAVSARLVHRSSTSPDGYFPRKRLLPPQGRSARVERPMVQAFDDTRPRALIALRAAGADAGRTGPAAQPRGGGVAARGHAAVQRRHRLGHGDLQAGGLLQAGARPHLRGHHLAVQPGGAGRLGDRHRGAPAPRAARDASATPRSSSRCRPTRRRSPTPSTTPRSSRSTRCCAGWSAWPARSPTSATAVPEDVSDVLDEAESWSSTWPSAGWSTR